MPLFKRRPKPLFRRQTGRNTTKVDFRSTGKNANAFARDRVRKVAANRFVQFLKMAAFVVVLGSFLLGILGFLGFIAFSLKNGGTFSFSSFLSTTPLRFLVKNTTTEQQNLQVVGLPGIPEYPGSAFIFEDYVKRTDTGGFTIDEKKMAGTDAQSLYTFLTSGQSTYRLPLNTEWSGVQSYYQDKLTKDGWKLEISVPVTDTQRIPGEYYTKDEKGLHIYTVSSDIWYELVTKEQAAQGLHDKIVAYKAKQELVAAASGRDLSSDAVWKLRYSRDWDAELQRNTIYGVNNIVFTHGKSNERVSILIVKRYKDSLTDLTYKNLEDAGVEYISTWLTTQQTTVTLQGFTRTERTVADGKAMEFGDLNNHAHFLFLVNKKNSLLYVVQYIGKDNPEFFEYIKANLKS